MHTFLELKGSFKDYRAAEYGPGPGVYQITPERMSACSHV
jgi:hypothetical protein